MPHAFGDVVVLILKSRDGDKDVLRRVNATVLASVVQPANPQPSTALKTHAGVLPEGEYLDVIYPRQFAQGSAPKASDLDSLFQRAHVVAPWKDGAVIGWEAADKADKKAIADMTAGIAILRQQLAEKDEEKGKKGK